MPDNKPTSSSYRFSLGMLLLLVFVVAVAAAALGGLLRKTDARIFFVLFTLSAPGAALVVVAAFQKLLQRK